LSHVSIAVSPAVEAAEDGAEVAKLGVVTDVEAARRVAAANCKVVITGIPVTMPSELVSVR
jgi:hypothetical protein